MKPKQRRGGRKVVAASILGEFRPIADLWGREDAPSEESVRWEIRTHRDALTAAGALAYRHGRLLFHPERYRVVIEQSALDRARRRAVIE